ncbi:MAG: AAA family ATPase [Muribaculaceae bacterium]|nr:AAA family ATPase [Muribaculaceae bacterium]
MKQSENILLKRVLRKTKVSQFSELDKIIGFYKTILELERSKEPDIATYYPYALHFKDNDSDVMLIDLPCNLNFTKAFLENRNLIFPKDLYVGLPVVRKDKSGQIVVFSLTVDYDDLKGYDPYENLLPIRITNLSLDSRHIDELELSEAEIEEIENEIGQVKSIIDLQELVKRHMGENAELKMELQLALSSKNIALAQISAELNKLSSSLAEKNELLKAFLTHSGFDNHIENISVDELIPVSALDDSQASVVAHALSNRFTVVTGAPGTGKTQVILNIIANALMKDKTVLVASKNNKAVDNVKERFDLIDPSKYLLRFGKKEYVRSQTVPALTQLLNRLNGLKNQPNTLSDLLSQYRDLSARIKEAKKKLSRIDELKVALPKLLSDKSNIESRIEEENRIFSSSVDGIKNRYSDVSHLENVSSDAIARTTSDLTRFRNALQRKYSGLSRIWHNLFSKRNHAEIFLGYVEDLPFSIKAELRDRKQAYSLDDFESGNMIVEKLSLMISVLERIVDYHRVLDKENKRHTKVISNLKANLDNIDVRYNSHATELESLSAKKIEFLHSITSSKTALINLGPQLIAAKISEIERDQSASGKISSYKSYLPDNFPRKESELAAFIRRSKDFLSVCRLISVTSLSVKSGFPLAENLFDILIIDEASQCDIASALPLILRAKQVVVIGDPMQLRHITSVRKEEENAIREHLGMTARPYLKYVEQSLWNYAADFLAHAHQNSFPITLENHYRCHHEIIGYSNHQFYSRFLDKPLNVKTDESRMTLPQKGVVMIDTRGRQESENININRIEADRAVNLAKELYSLKANVSIGIVTPFRNQADYIKSRLDESLKECIEVNTAFGFQGDEKDVIIYSLVVTDNSPKRKINWIDYITDNQVNVAVTRARQTLYIIGNADYIKRVSPECNALGYLIRYAQSKTK